MSLEAKHEGQGYAKGCVFHESQVVHLHKMQIRTH